ncbi:MAG: trypsin-like peptidase domain-containing protein [Verrucomicrobiota bacterium]
MTRLALLLATLWLPLGLSAESVLERVAIQDTPPDRVGPNSGYANIVEKTSPTVVSIASSRIVERSSTSQEEMLLRRFFGSPQRGERSVEQIPVPQGLGSGVILTTDGYILTNAHVIRGGDKLEVTVEGRDEAYFAEVVGSDRATDIAVIKIEAENLPASVFGNSDQLKVGDFVLAIGSPFGLTQSVTSGIVSSLGRTDLDITGYEDFIQTDASINPGNSGGALIDNKGRVVGINTAIFSRSGGNVGIGFAIPANDALEVASQLIDQGSVTRGYMGVQLAEVTKALSRESGLPEGEVVIAQVVEGTPAARAGLRPGDLVTAFGGEEIERLSQLRRLAAEASPGESVPVQISRNGQAKTLVLVVGKRPPLDVR